MLTAGAFLIAYSTACVLALVCHPIYGLMAYVAVFYIHPPSRWWDYMVPSLRWSLIAAAVTLMGVVLHSRAQHSKSFLSHGIVIWLIVFIGWLALQSLWALDKSMHNELLNYYIKYAIALALVYKSIETEQHLKMFLWTHVLGCFYFGWYAFNLYSGGRFESFGGPGFSDANFAGVQVTAGIFSAGALLLTGNLRERAAIIAVAPFLVNGLVTTMSRSGFLALACGGLTFWYFSPPKFRLPVAALGVLALALFLSLTNMQYWDRISTILLAGQEVEGVDTGSSRLVVWDAQVQMFAENPFGCGHRCTATLSPHYLDDQYLTGPTESRARSSHNTFLSLLVEQGVVGGIFYLLFLIWFIRSILNLRRRLTGRENSLNRVLPAAAAVLLSIFVADVFVDYLKLEVRFWFIGVILVIGKLAMQPSPETIGKSEGVLIPQATNGARGHLQQ